MASNLSYWKGIYEEWQSSKLTQLQFCKSKNLSYSSFCYWRGRVLNKPSTPQERPQTFIPVKLARPEQSKPTSLSKPSKAAIQIILPSGVSVDIHNHAEASLVLQMMKALGDAHA